LRATQSDHDILDALNTDYINSVQHSDVKRFDEILAPEFYCSNPDGSLVDRAAFLKQTAQPVAIRNLKAEDVMIRIIGNTAIIHGRTSFVKPDGTQGRGRYTDVWMRHNESWLAVSAQVTRL
jgi:ketosteroid isomerase-like protein